jgi:ketosteroid isomerase-like protein
LKRSFDAELDAAGHVAYKRFPSLQMISPLSLNKTHWLAITCFAFLAITLFAASEQSPTALDQIRSVLQAQQDAWNRGDIDGFMNGYARSASTVFISEDTIARGWQTVRDRYRKRYSNRTKMGTLIFSGLEITLLSSDSAIAFGRWRLKRANDQPHGRFTLILRRLPEGWRIVHDHTSAAAAR